MENTKNIRAFYEKVMPRKIESTLDFIKANGFNSEAYTMLRLLQDDLQNMNAVDHLYGAFHSEAKEEKYLDKRQGA